MKTLADFKRALTLGSKWHAIHASGHDMGIRTVAKVQSNSVAFKTEGKEALSWLDFPKSNLFKTNEKNEALIYWPPLNQGEENRHILTYKKIGE